MVWRRDAEALTWRSVVDFELRELNSPWQDFSFFRWRRVTGFGHRDDRQWGVGRKCHLTRNQLRASRYPIPAKNISFSLQHQNLLPGRLCFWSFELPIIRGMIRILILFMGACQQVNWTIREKNNNSNNSNKTRILHSYMASTLESKRGCIVGRRLLSSVDCMNQDIRRCDY